MVEVGFELLFLITISCLLITIDATKRGNACKMSNTVPDTEWFIIMFMILCP